MISDHVYLLGVAIAVVRADPAAFEHIHLVWERYAWAISGRIRIQMIKVHCEAAVLRAFVHIVICDMRGSCDVVYPIRLAFDDQDEQLWHTA